jgi:hypothetical protein
VAVDAQVVFEQMQQPQLGQDVGSHLPRGSGGEEVELLRIERIEHHHVDPLLLELERQHPATPHQGKRDHFERCRVRLVEPLRRGQRDVEASREVNGQLLDLEEAQLHQVRAEPPAVDGLGLPGLLEALLGEDAVPEQVLSELAHVRPFAPPCRVSWIRNDAAPA